jgi:predicted ArsR family transcriptional regulator
MRAAGLVVHRRVAQARGRPRDEWAIAATARPAGRQPRAYAALSRWLARAIPPTPGRLRQVERAGRAIGRELGVQRTAPPERAIGDALAALGFEPVVELRANGALSCTLRNCPFRDSVHENGDVVCTLHRGITRGLLDQIAPRARLARFVPHDPDSAGCEIDIERLADGSRGAAADDGGSALALPTDLLQDDAHR